MRQPPGAGRRRSGPIQHTTSNNTHQPTAGNPPPPRPYPMNSSRHFFDTTHTARTAPTSSSRPDSTSSSTPNSANSDLNSVRILPTRQNDSWGERAEDSGGGGWKEVAGRRRNEGAGQVTADSGRAAPEDDTDERSPLPHPLHSANPFAALADDLTRAPRHTASHRHNMRLVRLAAGLEGGSKEFTAEFGGSVGGSTWIHGGSAWLETEPALCPGLGLCPAAPHCLLPQHRTTSTTT